MNVPFTQPPSRVEGVALGSLLDSREPGGDPATAWRRARDSYRLLSPANRARFRVIVVGTGLAGAGAASALADLGYRVSAVTVHDAPRRAHSVAAQGGINAARARTVDNDSLVRFVTDTVKGGDYRARESEAFRLGEESVRVIDHMNALGAPFAREYGGSLTTRSFGGVQVSRTYYTRGQTGQQLQIAASAALSRHVASGAIDLYVRHEMVDLIVVDGRARGIVVRNLLTGALTPLLGDAVVLATGGYGSIYYHSTLAKNSNASAAWRAHRRGAAMAMPSLVQFHPTALPISHRWQSKTILMSESLRNDGRIWVPERAEDDRDPRDIPDDERDYYLERRYPAFGNLTPRDVASRAARERIDAGYGVGPLRNSVYLDFRDAIDREGVETIARRYSNLFHMYRDATGEDPYEVPMRIAPGAHFTMGGLWTDYQLMTTVDGLFAAGECASGYHGANRLGANSLLSACVDGWFTIPLTVPNYLAEHLGSDPLEADHPAVQATMAEAYERFDRLVTIDGDRPPRDFHRALGEILYRGCGVTRSARGLRAAIEEIRALRTTFTCDLRIAGPLNRVNQELEYAGRVEDFLELAELMCVDALDREESCGAHFRLEHQTLGGEAQRDDDAWGFVSAWTTEDWAHTPSFVRHAEPLTFKTIEMKVRDYR
ncbi:MAG: fumarate reductase/succinate dehydrogenase flavoprotein subunit [Bowdeniella nasicola]|nr:fumarate reductase/succinate dehydrogenase flavoprotein subunit [Bowdeniella nasicola]